MYGLKLQSQKFTVS